MWAAQPQALLEGQAVTEKMAAQAVQAAVVDRSRAMAVRVATAAMPVWGVMAAKVRQATLARPMAALAAMVAIRERQARAVQAALAQ